MKLLAHPALRLTAGHASRCMVCLALLAWSLSRPAPAQARSYFYAVNSAGLGDELTTITLSHRNPSFVLAGTVAGTILISEDAGATWQEFVVAQPRSLFYGRERQPDASWEYAPGLPGKSPQLQSWLRQRGLHTAGINLPQLLFKKGEKPVTINWIEVDWHNENRIWVATTDGLYRSNDRGRTFIRVFAGYTTPAERMVNAVGTDPFDPKKVIIGTAAGAWVSKDGGITYLRTMSFYLRDSYVREIWFDAEQQGLVHLALAGSAMASPDGGVNWITTHWHQWHPRGDVQSISLGPNNLRLMGTRDGVYASWQGGEMGTWQRRGYRFPHMAINKVMATSDPSRWYALTDEAIWVTLDSGVNWKKIYQTGGKEIPRWITTFKGMPEHVWLVTNRQIYRIGPPPKLVDYDLSMRRSPELLQVPELFDLLKRVLEHHHVYFEQNQNQRDRAPWAALMPSLTAGYHYAPALDIMNLKTFQYPWAPYTYHNTAHDYGHTWEVMAWWDLSRLIFTRASMPHWGRVDRTLAAIRQDLTERVHRLYREYLRVGRILVFAPPSDVLARHFHEIRLQEITSYLDQLSEGYWSKRMGGAP